MPAWVAHLRAREKGWRTVSRLPLVLEIGGKLVSLALVGNLVACSGHAATDDAPANGSDSSPPHFIIDFKPCETTGIECGLISVPADWNEPSGRQVRIEVTRIKAKDPLRRLGILLTNPGGPGSPGVDLPQRLANLQDPILDRFDIIGFNPRGTAKDQAIDCKFGLSSLPTDLQSAAGALDTEYQAFADACQEKYGAGLLLVGTKATAHDMDAIREALDETELNYLRSSYGTRLGAVYAQDFPTHLRAMLLDGVVLPENSRTSWSEGLTAAGERALSELDKSCAANPQCALSSDGLMTVYDRMATKLEGASLDIGIDRLELSAADFTMVVSQLLTSTRRWRRYRKVLGSGSRY